MREFSEKDAEKMYLLNRDFEVIKYTGDNSFESINHAKSFIKDYSDYKRFGFGRWAVINKTTNDFIGWCGLKFCTSNSEVDLGFRIFKDYWNSGIAAETSKACLEYDFTNLNINRIVGRARIENLSSIRVLEKIGMRFFSGFTDSNGEWCVYEIYKNDFF